MTRHQPHVPSLSGTLSGSEHDEQARSEKRLYDKSTPHTPPVHVTDTDDSLACAVRHKLPVPLIRVATARSSIAPSTGTMERSPTMRSRHTDDARGGSRDLSSVTVRRHTAPLPSVGADGADISLVSVQCESARLPDNTSTPDGATPVVGPTTPIDSPQPLRPSQPVPTVVVSPKSPAGQVRSQVATTIAPAVYDHIPFSRQSIHSPSHNSVLSTSSVSTVMIPISPPRASHSESDIAASMAATHPSPHGSPHSLDAISDSEEGSHSSARAAHARVARNDARPSGPPTPSSVRLPTSTSTSLIAAPAVVTFQSWTLREPQWWSDMWQPQVGSQVFLSLDGCEQQFFYLENLGLEVYHLIYDVLIPYRHMGLILRDTAELPKVPRPMRKPRGQPAVHAGPHVPGLAVASPGEGDHEDDAVSPFADIVTADFKPSSSKDVVTVEFVVANVLLDTVFGPTRKQPAGTVPTRSPGRAAPSSSPSSTGAAPTTNFTLTLPRVCFVVMFEQHLKETMPAVPEMTTLPLPVARMLPKRDVMEDSNERPTGRSASIAQSHSLWVRLQRGVSQGHIDTVIQLLAPMKPLKEARRLFPGRKASRSPSQASASLPPGSAVAAVAAVVPVARPHRRSLTESERGRDVADPLVHVMTTWAQLSYLASVHIVLCGLYFAAADDPRSLNAARRGFQKIVEKARDWRHIVSRVLGRDDFLALSPGARRFFGKAAFHLRAALDLCAVEAHLALGDWAAAQTLVDELSVSSAGVVAAASSTAVMAGRPAGPLRGALSHHFYHASRRAQMQRLLARTLGDPMFRGLPKTPSSLRQQCISPPSRRASTRSKDSPHSPSSAALTMLGSALVAPTPGVCRLLHVVDPGTYPAVPATSPHALRPTRLTGYGHAGTGSPMPQGPMPQASAVLVPTWAPSPTAIHRVGGAGEGAGHYLSVSSPLNTPSIVTTGTFGPRTSTHMPHPLHVAPESGSRLSIPSPPPLSLHTTASINVSVSESPGPIPVALVDVLPRSVGAEAEASAEPLPADPAYMGTERRSSLLSLTLSERSRTASPDGFATELTELTEEVPSSPLVAPAGLGVASPSPTVVAAVVPAEVLLASAACGRHVPSPPSPTSASRGSGSLAPEQPPAARRLRKSSKKSSSSTIAMMLPPPPPPSSTFIDRVVGIISTGPTTHKVVADPRVVKGLSPIVAGVRRQSRLTSEVDVDALSARSVGSRPQLVSTAAVAGTGGAAPASWPHGTKTAQVTQWLTLYARQRAWLQPGLFRQRAGGPTAVPMSLFQRHLRVRAPRPFRTGDEVVRDEAALWMPLLTPELRTRPQKASAGVAAGDCSTCGQAVESPAHASSGAPGDVGADVVHRCTRCGAVYGSLACLRSAVTRSQFVACGACAAALAEATGASLASPSTGPASPQLEAVRAAFAAHQVALRQWSGVQKEGTVLDWIAVRLFGRALAMVLTLFLCPIDTQDESMVEKVAYLDGLGQRCGIQSGLQRTSERVLCCADELLLAEALLQHVGVPFVADVTLAAPCTVWESLHALPAAAVATAATTTASSVAAPSAPAPNLPGEARKTQTQTQAAAKSEVAAAAASAEELVYGLCTAIAAALKLPVTAPHSTGSAAAHAPSPTQTRHWLSFLTNLRFMDELFDLCRSAFAIVPSRTAATPSDSLTHPVTSSMVIVLSPLVSVVSDMPRFPSCATDARATTTTLQQVQRFYGPARVATQKPEESASPITSTPTASGALKPVVPGWLNHARFYLEHASSRLTLETETEFETPLAASSFLSIASSVMSMSMSLSSHHHVPALSAQMWSSDEESNARPSEQSPLDGLHNVTAVLETSTPDGPMSGRTARVVLTASAFISAGSVLSLYGCPNLY